jgi:hypothetical protein
VSVVQKSPSSQFVAEPPPHVPEPLQVSPVVHALASSQLTPELRAQVSGTSLHCCWQNESDVQGLPVWIEQLPPEHVSVPLQNRPSVHATVLFGCVQVPNPLHTSSVHTLLSLVHVAPLSARQLSTDSLQMFWHTAPPVHGSPLWIEQLLPPQVSLPLQNRPSLHGDEFALCRHVPDALQMSVVHTLLSLAHGVFGATLSAVHAPSPSHVSVVHELPSSVHAVPCRS